MIRADLHIHSCLSPCGDLEMGPSAVIERAVEQKLTHIALCDHNSTRNCEAFAAHAKKAGLGFIPGIEVTTVEEAHVICLFSSLKKAFIFGTIIEDSLLRIALDIEKMGEQIVVNEEEEVIGEVDFYLSVASMLSVDDVVARAIELGAIAIPAHIDKPVFSIVSQLGFLPDLPFSAIELSGGHVRKSGGAHPAITDKSMRVISASDSHFLESVGACGFEIDCDDDNLFDILKERRFCEQTRVFC